MLQRKQYIKDCDVFWDFLIFNFATDFNVAEIYKMEKVAFALLNKFLKYAGRTKNLDSVNKTLQVNIVFSLWTQDGIKNWVLATILANWVRDTWLFFTFFYLTLSQQNQHLCCMSLINLFPLFNIRHFSGVFKWSKIWPLLQFPSANGIRLFLLA